MVTESKRGSMVVTGFVGKRAKRPSSLERMADSIIGTAATGYMWVDVADMKRDESYQRNFNEKKARRIAENWNAGLCDPIRVNLRASGEVYVVDGWHRKVGAEMAGVKSLECRVHDNLTVQQEAALFTLLQEERTAIRSDDAFRARLQAGEPVAVDIVAILKKYGAQPDFKGNASIKRPVWAFASAEQVYTVGGPLRLDRVVKILTSAWPTDRLALSMLPILGVNIFLHVHGEAVDDARLISKLSQTSPGALTGKAKGLAAQLRGNAALYAAVEVCKLYNHKATKNRIDENTLLTMPRGLSHMRKGKSSRTVASDNLFAILEEAE